MRTPQQENHHLERHTIVVHNNVMEVLLVVRKEGEILNVLGGVLGSCSIRAIYPIMMYVSPFCLVPRPRIVYRHSSHDRWGTDTTGSVVGSFADEVFSDDPPILECRGKVVA